MDLTHLLGELFTLHLVAVETGERLTWTGYVTNILPDHRAIVLTPVSPGPRVALIRAATGAMLTTIEGRLCRLRGVSTAEDLSYGPALGDDPELVELVTVVVDQLNRNSGGH